MKYSSIYKLTILLLISSVSFFSCNSDDSFFNSLKIEEDGSFGGTDSNSDEEGNITLYRVNGDNIEKIKDYKVSGANADYQKDVAKHQELWTLIKKIIPPSYRSFMAEFLIFNGEESGTAGFVFELNEDLSKWQMGIAINYADDQQELVYTIIHEFGHILTLNNTQVNSSVSSGDCSTYFTGEGCSKSSSYINNVYKNYWADIWDEFQAIGDNSSAHEAFYDSYSDRFVTNYAATNPGEDIAEVFATFVTRNDKPSGSTIAEQKIRFMHDRGALVELRNFIRNEASKSKNASNFLPAPGSWKRATTLGNHKSSHHIREH